MLSVVVPRIDVRQVVLATAGTLASGTSTPGTPIPTRIVAADVFSAAGWTFTNAGGYVGYPVAAGESRHLPGSFVKDAIFSAGTYVVCLYLDA